MGGVRVNVLLSMNVRFRGKLRRCCAAALVVGVYLPAAIAGNASEHEFAEDETHPSAEVHSAADRIWARDDFADDLEANTVGLSLQARVVRKPRFVPAGEHFGESDNTDFLGRYDILQEARAARAFADNAGQQDLVIRWETSFSYRVSSIATVDGHERRIFRVEPQPKVRFMIVAESRNGERRVLFGPKEAPADKRPLTLPDSQGEYLIGGGCNHWLAREVATSVKSDGREQLSAEMAECCVELGVWPKSGQVGHTAAPTTERRREEVVERLLHYYRRTGKYVPRVDELGDWLFNAKDWPVVDRELYVHVDMIYHIRADDQINAPLHPLSGWCVFVPRGWRELHDMDISDPVIRRTYPYDESLDAWLKPLLEVTSIAPLK